MKIPFKITCIVFILLLNSGIIKAQSSSDAVQYMDNLSAPFEDIDSKKWQYLKAMTRGKSAKKVDKRRQNLLVEIKEVRNQVRRVRSYEGETTYKGAILDYLQITEITLKEDYDKILNMEEIAEQSYDFMEAYLLAREKANEKLMISAEKFREAQTAFALKYNITLLEKAKDKQDLKIESANQLLKYYNELYLIFFKSYKQEVYVMDALSRSDVNGTEQTVNALLAFSKEGLEQLKSIETFNGDSKLIYATKEMLQFYKSETENDFATIVDFYIKKDNFERIQKRIDAKRKKDRTQKDIDKYNGASAEFNKAVANYNNVINSNNRNRSVKLNSYNKTVDQFFDKHS